jgi:tetrahydromethanopterin S-methyltransferase subunit E
VAFLIRHGVAGVIAGWVAVGALLSLDVGGLGRLVMTSDLFPLPLLMLLAFFGITFGSVALGSAIMGLGRGDAADAAHDRLLPSGRPAARGGIDGRP